MPLLTRVWFVFGGAIFAAILIFLFTSPQPPGYAIGLLGFLAILMTFRKDPGTWEKVMWIGGTFFLMVAELFAIGHDRKEQDIRHHAELMHQQQLFDASIARLTIIESGITSIPSEVSKNIKPSVTNILPGSSGNVKERCVDLAARIRDKISHRYEQLSKYPQPITRESLETWLKSNDSEFRHWMDGDEVQQAKVLRDDLAQLHLRDLRLDEILDDDDRNLARAKSDPRFIPYAWMSIEQMKEIADRLSALADKIKN